MLCGGGDIPKDIVTGLSNFADQNSHLKILLDVFGDLIGRGSLLTPESNTRTFNFQSNDFLSKFKRQLLLHEVPWSEKKDRQ